MDRGRRGQRAEGGGPRRSVATDLLLLSLATLLPLLILGAYLSYRNVQEARAAIYTDALRQSRETARRADGLVAETQALLTGLAETPTLRAGDRAQVRALLRDVRGRFPYYDDFFVVDLAGNVYASAAGPDGEALNVAMRPYFQTALRDDTLAVSEVLSSPTTGQPVVAIGLPFHAADGGPPIGVVAAELDLIQLPRWLDDRGLAPGATITVVDQQGRVLARSLDPELWVGRAIGEVPVVRTAIVRDEGIVDGANVDGIARLNGFATARRVPWTVLVGIPGDAVYAPLRQEIGLTVARLALAALAAGVLAMTVGRRIVLPVRELTAGVRAIAAGDRSFRIALHRRDELGQLATAMNQMTDELVGAIAAHQGAQQRLETAVTQVGRAMTSAVEPHALLTPLVEAASTLTQADASLLVLRDGTAPVLSGTIDPPPAFLAELLRRGQDEAPAAGEAPRWPALPGMGHQIVVTVRAHGQAVGVLAAFRQGGAGFSAGDARLLHTFAAQVAVAIEQARLRATVAQAEALRELHRLQSEFLTTASHELRAPIAGIKGYAEMLVRDDLTLDDETRRECLIGINRLSEHLTAQVRAFFDTMRAGKARLELRRVAVDLGALAAATAHSFGPRSEKHAIRVTVAPDLPPTCADPDRVADVFANLLDNAIKYSPAGGEIVVRLALAGEDGDSPAPEKAAMVVATVRDRGIGIPPEEQGRIFERFYRLDQAITRHAGGAGLGLYLCRAYVEGMGGRLWVESRPGEGSAFHFTLPAMPVPGAPAERIPTEVTAR